MRLKLFILPIAIIISITTFISYVWPEYESIQENIGKLEKAENTLKAAQDREKNIQGLVSQLDNNAWSERALDEYLPIEGQSDELINAIEQLINQSSVSLLGIGVREGVAASSAGKGQIDVLTGEVTVPNVLNIGRSGINITVSGEYGALVDFLRKIDAFKRESKTLNYSLAVQELEDGSNILVMNADMQFGFAPRTKLGNDQTSAVFEKQQFNLDAIDAYKNKKIKANVNNLDAGQTGGKTNPFAL